MNSKTSVVLQAALSFSVILWILACEVHAQETLALWTFEVSQPRTAGPHAAEEGLFGATSFASGHHASPFTDYNDSDGNGSPTSFRANNWAAGDYFQFTTSTLGFQDIAFKWDQTRNSNGPAPFRLRWSIDGNSFFNLHDYTVQELSWSASFSVGGSVFGPINAPAALNDRPTVWFRLVALTAGSNTSGHVRVDNVMISGNPIPAPGALAAMAILILPTSRRRRA